MTTLLDTTNIIAAGNNMRSIGRMIYDRLAYYDPEPQDHPVGGGILDADRRPHLGPQAAPRHDFP